MKKNAVIVSMARTAVGGFGGSLKGFSAIELGTFAVRAALDRAKLSGDEIGEVLMGCVGQYGMNAFLARMVGLNAGVSQSAGAQTMNRMCASGLQAIATASAMIERGDVDVAIAGGAESMSNFPYLLNDARWGMRMGVGPNAMLDALNIALCEPTAGVNTHIAVTAENIAAQFGITREALDAHAFETQNRAIAAIEAGLFKDEIVPVEIKERAGVRIFDTDEHPRATTLEKLAKLRPFAKKDGIVTAGNASGINDGAAALVLMSEEKAKELGLAPIARVVDWAAAGVDPQYMGLGPVDATQKLMAKTGMNLSDIGLFELNEAFAAQAIGCMSALGLNPDIVNVNGSGISLGHPIGATGAIISIKLISEMKRRNVKFGVASLCIGGGQGMSALFEAL